MKSKQQRVEDTVLKVALVKGRKLRKEDVFLIARVALNPPKNVTEKMHWLDVVVRGFHSNYEGAMTHFRASCFKYGIRDASVWGGLVSGRKEMYE